MRRSIPLTLLAACMIPALVFANNLVDVVHNVDALNFVNGRKIDVDADGNIHICYVDYESGRYKLYYRYSTDMLSWARFPLEDNASYAPAAALDAASDSTVYIAWRTQSNAIKVWKKKIGEPATSAIVAYDIDADHPSLAIDEESGKGTVFWRGYTTHQYIDEWPEIRSESFDLSDLSSEGRTSTLVEPYPDFIPIGVSVSGCAGLVDGSFMAAHFASSFGVPEPGYPQPYCFGRMADIDPWRNPFVDYQSRNMPDNPCGTPSLCRWDNMTALAAYSDHSSVRFWICDYPSLDFDRPDSDDGALISLLGAGVLEPVQIAYDGLPFVVWERNDKIYYSNNFEFSPEIQGSWTQWSSAARLTTTSAGIREHDPHTAVDWRNNVVYVLWIEEGADTAIRITTLTLDELSGANYSYYTPSNPVSNKAGQFSSLAIDDNDDVHISYTDPLNGNLYYTKFSGGSFSSQELVASGVMPGTDRFTSIAVDPAGNPHISYTDDFIDQPRHAWKDQYGWHYEPWGGILTAPNYFNAIAIDQTSGSLHVCGDLNGRLHWGSRSSSGTWTGQCLDPSMAMTYHCDIAVDPPGLDMATRAHIVYQKLGSAKLWYACKAVGGTTIMPIDANCTANTSLYPSIAVDTTGYPHVSYSDKSRHNGCIMYAYYDGITWHLEEVDPNITGNVSTSITIDKYGYPMILYYATGSPAGPRFARRLGDGHWIIETVEENISTNGFVLSIGVNSNRSVICSYYDIEGTDGQLGVAQRFPFPKYKSAVTAVEEDVPSSEKLSDIITVESNPSVK
jgi:hypothetical protein